MERGKESSREKWGIEGRGPLFLNSLDRGFKTLPF
jgi:hypothetical protein